jgi:hypothetical protein
MLKKLLLSLMVLGAISTTIGAGTFASFTGSTTNASSTFATGSVILSNVKPSSSACVSAGAAATETAGTVTNDNVRTDCDILFDATSGTNATSKRPGEYGALNLTLKNVGTISTGTLTVKSTNACSISDPSDQPFPYGTTNTCGTVQLSIGDGTTCYWGDNMTTSGQSPYITGTRLTYPVVIASSATSPAVPNNKLNITVNGTTRTDVTIANGSYADATALKTAINTAFTASSVSATASAYDDGTGTGIRITSGTTSGAITINTASTATNSALSSIGFMTGASAAGAGQCATGTGDQAHALSAFYSAYTSTPLALGNLVNGTPRVFTIRLGVPSKITDQEQARKTGFDLTWVLTG